MSEWIVLHLKKLLYIIISYIVFQCHRVIIVMEICPFQRDNNTNQTTTYRATVSAEY